MATAYQTTAASAIAMPQSHSEPAGPKVEAATTSSGLRDLTPHDVAVK